MAEFRALSCLALWPIDTISSSTISDHENLEFFNMFLLSGNPILIMLPMVM